jgi:hypothetical protein
MEGPTPTGVSRRFHTRDSNSNLRHQKRDTRILLQANAREELRIISQPPDVDLATLPGFAYNSTAGKDVTVFIIDSGINPRNPVSALSNSPED